MLSTPQIRIALVILLFLVGRLLGEPAGELPVRQVIGAPSSATTFTTAVDAARAQARAADYLVEAARGAVGLDVVKACQQLTASRKKLELLRTQVKTKTRLILDRARIACAAGSATLLDLLDAQRIYRQSALDELAAIGDLERGVAAPKRAMAADVPRGSR